MKPEIQRRSFSAKLTEEGVANRRSRQSVAVTAIVNIFSWQNILSF